MKITVNRACAALLLGLCSVASQQEADANTPILTDTNRDVLLCFRQAGANNDLEVDVGQASKFYNASPGATIPISQYSVAQMDAVFADFNNLTWSAGAAVRLGDGGDASVPVGTLWITAPRTDPSTPAAPWKRQSSSTQGATAAKIKTILDNAAFFSGTIPADPDSNTTSVVAVPVGSDHEYGFFAGPLGNYGNTFYGDVENTTTPSFTTEGLPSRSDFYEIRPAATGTQPPGKYLGYFELETDGSMSFFAGSSAPIAPTLSITDVSGVQTISFPTITGETYTLYYTDAAGLQTAVSSWSKVSTNIVGDGTVQSFQQSSADTTRFYVVEAH